MLPHLRIRPHVPASGPKLSLRRRMAVPKLSSRWDASDVMPGSQEMLVPVSRPPRCRGTETLQMPESESRRFLEDACKYVPSRTGAYTLQNCIELSCHALHCVVNVSSCHITACDVMHVYAARVCIYIFLYMCTPRYVYMIRLYLCM